jgi:hypothetical protein
MSSIAGELLTQVLPHIGAAYSLAQDVKAMSPAHLAAVREMTKSVDQINAIVLAEMQAERSGSDPRQIDIAEAIAATVKSGPRRSRGPREQFAGRMAGKAPRPPGTNRGV